MRDLGLSTVLESKIKQCPVGDEQLKVGFHRHLIFTCVSALILNFTHVNKIEAMYESLCVDVKVERWFSFLSSRTTFHTFMSISFTHANITRNEIHPYDCIN